MAKSKTELKPATLQDRPRLAELIELAGYVHRHLDWLAPLDWLGSRPYWLIEEDTNLRAAMACPDDPGGIAWIRLFASRQQYTLSEDWERLFEACKNEFQTRSDVTFAAISLYRWFEELLTRVGFRIKQKIVVLEWPGMNKPPVISSNRIQIRPLEKSDLPNVALVDRSAFDLLWQNSLPSLALSLEQAAYATVALMNGEIVGYQICTGVHYSAHLARLAVLPNLQGNSIGSLLVSDLQVHFYHQDVIRVSVNTQSDNSRSLALYEKMGFKATGDTFNVFTFA